MHRFTTGLACAGLLALVSACQTDDPAAPVGADRASSQIQNRTPFQQAIQASIASRTARKLAAPSRVTFDYHAPAPAMRVPGAPSRTTIVATTVIHYDGPAQAGLTKWPDLIVTDNRAPGAEGIVREGDYTELVRQKLAEEIPGVWQHYTYGYEPRTYTITETIITTEPGALPAAALSAETTADDFVMGFTVPGPGLDYTIDWDFEVCVVVCSTAVEFLAGFKLDWTLAMRLPMALSLTSPAPMLEGSTYTPSSVATGLDWSGQQYTAAGILPEDGNEYVVNFAFVLGVFLEVFGAEIIDLGPNIQVDRTKSFTTPLGAGQTFALPSIDIPIWEFDASVAAASVGFKLTPNVGSDRFTTAWAATSEASGGGALTYTTSGTSVPVGPVLAIDGPGVAAIRLNDLRYHFTQFLLDLGLFFHLDVFAVVEETFTVPITDFNLSAITGGLSMGTHDGTPGSLLASIPIENVAPTAAIDRTGTTLIQGVPTFVGEPGSFTGTATDPGRDDLTLSWDWSDGPPAPDVSTVYPVPHDVTETQAHTFGRACVYNVRFRAVDDDQAFAEDVVPVVIAGGSRGRSRMEGYWQHQYMANGHLDYDAATLQCFLNIASHMSAVFGEARSLASRAHAVDVLHLGGNHGSSREQFDRELLVAWLNFAAGAFEYGEMVPAGRGGTSHAPLAAVLALAEEVRLNPGATDAQLDAQTQILHAVNVSRVGAI